MAPEANPAFLVRGHESIDAVMQEIVGFLAAPWTHASAEVVNAKNHIVYLREYLEHLTCRTLVLETEYVDGDFLEDYANYYVRCFEPYRRFCRRLHFFSTTFDEGQFTALLDGKGGTLTCEQLKGSYLGFIVIRDLPKAVIARTCLVTYPPDETAERCYPVTRRYPVHLFGIELSVETLAFQEQDQVVAACATSALWSAFQGTAKLFQHPILSPVAITHASNSDEDDAEDRAIPSPGLNLAQMARAARRVGLEPSKFQIRSNHELCGIVYAYLRAKIPVLMGVQLVDMSMSAGGSAIGMHAVAVTGFRLGRPPVPLPNSGTILRASRINKVYVHDDQVGPFARMELKKDEITYTQDMSGTLKREALTTSWRTKAGRTPVDAVPISLMAPLYHKVRIRFNAVYDAVLELDARLNVYVKKGGWSLTERPEWDIFLSSLGDFKAAIFAGAVVARRREILERNAPRFVWRAIARTGGVARMELLFDATDVDHGAYFLRSIDHDEQLASELSTIAKAVLATPQGRPMRKVTRDIFRCYAER